MRGQHLQVLALRDLPLVLSYLPLVLVHLGILAFLLAIVNEEMAELLVDVFPHVVLCIGNHAAGLGRFGHHSTEASDVVGLREFLVKLIHGKEVSLVILEDNHVVLQDGQHNMPEVEGLAHKLKHFWLKADLRGDRGQSFKKEPWEGVALKVIPDILIGLSTLRAYVSIVLTTDNSDTLH
jgi:hypothetical protein